MQKQATSMPWTQAQHQAWATTETAVRRCELSTKEPITTKLSIAKDPWASSGYATLNCAVLLKCELLRASARCQLASTRRQIGTDLFFSFKPLPISPEACVGTPFEFVFNQNQVFFIRKDKHGQEVKIS